MGLLNQGFCVFLPTINDWERGNRPSGAFHIAATSVAKCKFLLTWKFRHIANVRIRSEVERILARYAMQEQQSPHTKSSSDYETWEDEVLSEVSATRDDYAAEHGYNLDRIYADLKQREGNSLLRKAPDDHSVKR